jgi:tetratricopeptide (TPR) repeat protein
VALARERGDRAALAHVLTMRVTAVWWPETLSERVATTAELVPLTDAVGDPTQRFWAAVWRAVTVVQAGDLAEADRQLDRQRDIAARLRQPRLAFVLEAQRAWRAQLAGRLDDAERLADQARTLGEEAGEPDALSLYVGQLGPIRWHQGRLGEEADLLSSVAEAVPAVSAFAAMAALAELEAGQQQHAAERLRAQARDEFASLPCDPVQLGSLIIWAEVAARLADRQAASLLLARVEPLREQIALDSLGALGVASRSAGLLAATLGRWNEADRHFAYALELHERLGASSLAVRTQLEWGLALALSGRRERASRAGELLSAAAAVAGELRLPGLRDRAHAALSGSGALV